MIGAWKRYRRPLDNFILWFKLPKELWRQWEACRKSLLGKPWQFWRSTVSFMLQGEAKLL